MSVTRRRSFVNLHTIGRESRPMSDVNSVFVYGTLKCGQCRADCWPCEPLGVEPASTSGALYDLGPYPALLTGPDRVVGEIWTFAAADMDETLAVLDQIECYGQGGVDLYLRRIVPCGVGLGQADTVRAYCYFLADADSVVPDQRVTAGTDGYCRWPRMNQD